MKKDETAITYIYIPATVNALEAWLKRKSLEGLRLSKKVQWKFYFENCIPCEREYFLYSDFDRSRGIAHDFNAARQKYRMSKSTLNKNSATIFEADPRKIDLEYHRTKRLRNAYYFKHYVKLFFILFIFFAVSIFLTAAYSFPFIVPLSILLPLIYAAVSMLILIKTPR